MNANPLAGVRPAFLLVPLLLVAAPRAQEDAAAPDLATVCAKMQALSGVGFQSYEEQDSAMTRRFKNMMPAAARETEVSGRRAGPWLVADITDGEQELVLHGSRMIARESGGSWCPRRNVDVFGAPLPFVFDPALFFERIASVGENAGEIRTQAARWREGDYQILELTLTGEAARSVVLGGGVPATRGMGGAIMIGGPGGGLGQADVPEMTVDLAMWIDPSTGLCHRMKASSYQESSTPQGMRFEIQGADLGDENDAEKINEFDAEGNRLYRNGLPVRAVDESTSAMHFDVELRDHGQAAAPELDDGARQLLGLGKRR